MTVKGWIGRKHTDRRRWRKGGWKKKVCAVRYADESLIASMQEWTHQVPVDHTHQGEHTHRMPHQRAYKPALEIENTDT